MAHDTAAPRRAEATAPRRSVVERAAERLERTGGAAPATPAGNGAANGATNGAAPGAFPGTSPGGHAAPVSDSFAVERPETAARAARRARPLTPVDMTRLKRTGHLTFETMQTRLGEQIRLIKRSVLHARRESTAARPNVIMTTSAAPSEGKTFIAVNLAMSLACEMDHHVLLVDGDFQRPSITELLGVQNQPGFLDALEDEDCDLGEIIHPTDVGRLSLIGAGRHRQLSPELLSSQRMTRVVDELSSRYADRLIIFDTPPLLAASEGPVMAELMGQILFVVEAERTGRETLIDALDLLPPDADPALILNKGHSKSGFGSLYYNSNSRARF